MATRDRGHGSPRPEWHSNPTHLETANVTGEICKVFAKSGEPYHSWMACEGGKGEGVSG